MHQPRAPHLQVVKHIFRYLADIATHGLFLHKQPCLQLRAYANADWAGYKDIRQSTLGFCLFPGLNIVSWHTKKQATMVGPTQKLNIGL